MGFQRTSEGRVFFKTAGQTAQAGQNTQNGQSVREEAANGPLTGSNGAAQSQMQILLLLRSLNEKLKATKSDRVRVQEELSAYKNMIQMLEDKAERSERAYLDLEQKVVKREELVQATLKELEETRRRMVEMETRTKTASVDLNNLKSQISQNQKINQGVAKKQIEIEQVQTEQAEKLASGLKSYARIVERLNTAQAKLESAESQYHAMAERLNETASEQAKLARKIDKAIEDRTRFMRQIQRIEETVIQTRDSLNARALLAAPGDSAVSAQSPAQGVADTDLNAGVRADAYYGPAYAPPASDWKAAWWTRPYRFQAVAVALFIVGGILTGWMISEMQKPGFSEGIGQWYQSLGDRGDEFISTPAQDLAGPGQPEWSSSTDTSAFSAGQAQSQPGVAGDPFAFIQQGRAPSAEEERLMLERFESDPAAVAAALNAIEPSTPQAAPEPTAEQAPMATLASAGNQATEPVINVERDIEALVPEKTATIPPAETQPAKKPEITSAPASGGQALRDQMASDAALPEQVKPIEAEAYNGSPEAQHDLAAIYTAGHAGVPQNYGRAAFWFTQAAKAGIPNAQYNLGVLYHQGLGISSDLEQAIYWYKAAADKGHPEAQYNLGIAYIEGIGVDYDPESAARNFESAARKGIVEAAYNLGLIYENGLLGQAKPDEALMWFKEAADQGSPEAKTAMEQLARNIGIEPKDIGRIVENVKSLHKSDAQTTSVQGSVFNSGQNEDQVLVAQVQEYLMGVGLYPGPADGITGPLTMDAVRSYQALNKMDIDGRITRDLLSHMLANTGQSADHFLRDPG